MSRGMPVGHDSRVRDHAVTLARFVTFSKFETTHYLLTALSDIQYHRPRAFAEIEIQSKCPTANDCSFVAVFTSLVLDFLISSFSSSSFRSRCREVSESCVRNAPGRNTGAAAPQLSRAPK